MIPLLATLWACGGPDSPPPKDTDLPAGPSHQVSGPREGLPTTGTTTTDSGTCPDEAPCGVFEWAVHYQSTNSDFFHDLDVGPDGSVATIGRMSRDLTIGVGRADAVVVPEGCGAVGWEGIVVVHEPDGSVRWTQQISTCSDVWGQALAVGTDGSVVVGGQAFSTTTFGPGQPTEAEIGPGRTLFVAKYDSSGAFLWVRSMDVDDPSDVADIALGPTGEVYATGRTGGPMVLHPGGAAEVVYDGTLDAPWIAAYDADGQALWATVMPEASNKSQGIATMGGGPIWTSTGLSGAATFGTGTPSEITVTSTPGTTTLMASFAAANGALIWASFEGGSNPRDLDSDGADTLLIMGNTSSSAGAIFDPGLPTEVSLTGDAHYVASYDSAGTVRWATGLSSGVSSGSNVALGDGVVATSGNVVFESMFTACGPTLHADALGDAAQFAATYDLDDGSFQCAWQWGGPDLDKAEAVGIAPDGSVYAVGSFKDSITFAAGTPDETVLDTTYPVDGYLIKFGPPPP